MNKDILSKWDSIKTRLTEIRDELENDFESQDLTDDIADELDMKVIDRVKDAIVDLEDLIDSSEKMEEAEAFYDPYDEGLE
jgi:hypothetical protein